MKRTRIVLVTLAALGGLVTTTGCAPSRGPAGRPTPAAKPVSLDLKNPLLRPWSGPHGGTPAFPEVRVAHFEPAFRAAMDAYRQDVAAIVANPAAPTFENTLAALEDAGRVFGRVSALFGIWSSARSDPPFQAVERKLAPVLARFGDELAQNAGLFKRLEAVYGSPEKARLTPEQQRLVWFVYTTFVRAGAKLDAAAKQRVAAINERLATLYTEFSQALLGEEESYRVVLESEADLAGLPDSVRAGAAAAATEKKLPGRWLIANTRSAVDPFLTFSSRRDLREKVWRQFVRRGDNGDARDNHRRIAEILKLRAERAKLLGYATHAHWRLEDSMARTPDKVMALLEAVWRPAAARVREEVRDMQAIADREQPRIVIAPWDYRYYAEKVRKAKFDLDQNEVKDYLQLDELRKGLFFVAGELFGLELSLVTDVPVYHADVTVYAVKDRASGRAIGLWFFDPWARAGKQSGAWMSAWRNQERFRGSVTTIVSNNANFIRGKAGEPVLVSWDDARTLFHEFGHALHGLVTDVQYPSLSGTNVARDYVEFPSQLLEHWLDTPEVLSRFALHHRTRQPIPQALVEKIRKAATFNMGFTTMEYLASALIDMKLHLAGGTPIDPAAFERDTLKALGMPEEIVMRHRTPQFAHIFAGDGYSAGYYSYLWADVITADALEAFSEGRGSYDRAVAARLRQHVFQVGNTIDPAEGYRAFRGRDASLGALLRKRGFPAPAPR
jgi:peptidyl-dipeptidase Dcp